MLFNKGENTFLRLKKSVLIIVTANCCCFFDQKVKRWTHWMWSEELENERIYWHDDMRARKKKTHSAHQMHKQTSKQTNTHVEIVSTFVGSKIVNKQCASIYNTMYIKVWPSCTLVQKNMFFHIRSVI